ncbi:Cyanophycinase [Meiothermus ruber H328]|nr:Cyanophycinase [Meiothermus ruber H328]
MPSPTSPYAQQDEQFRKLLEQVHHATQQPGVKFLALIRKRYQGAIIWVCASTSKAPQYAEIWGTGESPLEALLDLVELLGMVPASPPEQGGTPTIQNEACPSRKNRGSVSHAKAPRRGGPGSTTGERGDRA